MPPALHKYRQSCKREAEEGEETVVVRGGVQRRERGGREKRYGGTKERRTKGNKPTVAEEAGKEDLILRRKGKKSRRGEE